MLPLPPRATFEIPGTIGGYEWSTGGGWDDDGDSSTGGGDFHIQAATVRRCGPDVTKWLQDEIRLIADAARADKKNRDALGGISKKMAPYFLLEWGSKLNYAKAKDVGEGDKKGTTFSTGGDEPCPVSCPNSVTVCGKCIDASELGNMVYGALGAGAGWKSAGPMIGVTQGALALGNLLGADIDAPDSEEDENSITTGHRAAKEPGDEEFLCALMDVAGPMQAETVTDCEACASAVPSVFPKPRKPKGVPGTDGGGENGGEEEEEEEEEEGGRHDRDDGYPRGGGNHTSITWNVGGFMDSMTIPENVNDTQGDDSSDDAQEPIPGTEGEGGK